MAADSQVVIEFKTTADTKGGKDAEQSIDRVEKKAKRSLSSIVGGMNEARRAAGVFQKAVGFLSNFGFVTAGFNSVISIFDKFISSESKAKEEAIALAAAEKEAADAKRVEKLAEAYKKLTTEIADAAKARERANELEDMQRTAADKLEDDTAELKMREEIAALDTNDPLYDKKKEQISARYETEKLRKSVARQQRDAGIAEERTRQEHAATVGESTEKQFSLISDREELEQLKREAARKRAESVQENEFDAQGVGERFAQNLKAILTLNGERFGDDRTEKGDERRKQLEEEAKALEEKAKAKEAEIKAKEKEIADLDKTAEHLAKKAGIQGDIAINAGVAVESANISSATTNKAADKALADEQKKIADAEAARTALTAQKADLQSRLAAEQAKKDAAGKSVYEAQGNYDMVASSGSRGARALPAAQAALTEAKNAAQNVNYAADAAINALTETLKSVEQRLKAAQSYLESQSKQQRNAWSEAPAGT